MLGYVTSETLGRWYGRARVFAFPSLDEGFGMPVLEAMSAGVPVLAANRAALPEVCGDAALLVDPEDVEALAAALGQLMGGGELREKLIGAGLGSGGSVQLGKGSGTDLERLPGIADLGSITGSVRTKRLFRFFVDSDFERPQKALVLGGELDLASGLESVFHFRAGFLLIIRVAVFVTLVETDGGFEHQEHVVTGLLDLADGFGDSVGVREGIVDRIPQFLHEIL